MSELKAPLMSQADYRAWRQERTRTELAEHVAVTGVAPIRITGKVFYWT